MGSTEDTVACGSKRKRLSLNEDINLSEEDVPKAKYSNIEKATSLMNFSDEILLEIFQYLDCFSLANILKTCTRMSNVASENRLWKIFDISSKPLKTTEILSLLQYINMSTTQLKIRGITNLLPRKKWKNYTLNANMLKKIVNTCPRLTSMTIHDGLFNVNEITIKNFPKSLESLTFVKCQIINFYQMHRYLPKLKELNVINCDWFQTHDLLIFSKLPELRVLNLTGCNSMKDCVQYGSLASRSGFKKLEVLNLTHTPVSDSDIQCFNIIMTLKELIIECPLYLRSEIPNTTVHYPPIDYNRMLNVNPVVYEQPLRLLPNDMNLDIQLGEEDNAYNIIDDNANGGQRAESSDDSDGFPDDEGEDEEEDVVEPPRRHIRVELPDLLINPPQLPEPREFRMELRHRRSHLIPDVPNPDAYIDNEFPLGDNNIQRNEDLRGNHVIIVHANLEPNNRNIFLFDEEYRLPNDRFFVFERNYPLFRPLVSDRGICSYGIARDNVQEGIIWFRAEPRSPNTLIEKFVLRHYKGITDVSLKHLVSCSPNLKYMDLTGTSVTSEGVQKFLESKPQCTVIF